MFKIIAMKKAKKLSVFTIFKILHFIMKLFGLFPFKIKHTETGPKCVNCICGLILTTMHFFTYFCSYISVLVELYSNPHIMKSKMTSIVDRFGSTINLYIEGISIIILFASILIKNKAQKNILRLFYQTEAMLINKSFNCKFLQIFLYSFVLSLNFILGFIVSVTLYGFYQAVSSTDIIYLMVRILPHFYILIKTSQFVFYILMLNFGFDSLNSIEIQ